MIVTRYNLSDYCFCFFIFLTLQDFDITITFIRWDQNTWIREGFGFALQEPTKVPRYNWMIV